MCCEDNRAELANLRAAVQEAHADAVSALSDASSAKATADAALEAATRP